MVSAIQELILVEANRMLYLFVRRGDNVSMRDIANLPLYKQSYLIAKSKVFRESLLDVRLYWRLLAIISDST